MLSPYLFMCARRSMPMPCGKSSAAGNGLCGTRSLVGEALTYPLRLGSTVDDDQDPQRFCTNAARCWVIRSRMMAPTGT